MYVSVGAPGEVMPILSPRSARSRSCSGDCALTPFCSAISLRMTRVRVTRLRMSCTMTTESSPSERSSARSSKPTSAYCALPEASAAMLSLPLSTSTMLTLMPSLVNSPSSLATYSAERNTLGADAIVIVFCCVPAPAFSSSDEPPHPAADTTSAAASAVALREPPPRGVRLAESPRPAGPADLLGWRGSSDEGSRRPKRAKAGAGNKAFIFTSCDAITSVGAAATEPDVRPPPQRVGQRTERDAQQQDDRGQHDRPGNDPGGLVAAGGRPRAGGP